MTILPIVDRELRVTARRAGVYWLRFGVALAGMAIWVVLLLNSRVSAVQLGQHLFNAMGVLALGFGLLAGVFLTADCLSAEKREGTLGLLFLTDLKGHDVVLGKLAAHSVHALFGLLAIFPVLGLPLLHGGVTGTEFGRVLVVLAGTLFFSLSVGMLISAFCHDARQAMGRALLVVTVLAGVFPAFWWLQSTLWQTRFWDWLLWPSPAYAYLMAFDAAYRSRSGPQEFWASLGTILLLGVGSVAWANRRLPCWWQEREPGRLAWRRFRWLGRLVPNGNARAPEPRVRLGTQNPICWLGIRDRSPQRTTQRVLALFLPLWALLLVASIATSKHKEAFIACMFVAYGLHLIVKVLLAVEATRRWSEDRRSGALELLLATPLPVAAILAGQRTALKRQFHGAFVRLFLVNAALITTVLLFDGPLDMQGSDQAIFVGIFFGGILLLVADGHALGWVGMWRGLTAQRHPRAVMATLGQVLGIPWVLLFFAVFTQRGFGSTEQVARTVVTWVVLGLIVDAINSRVARKKLELRFRTAAAF